MVKAKAMKQLRKKVQKAERIENPLIECCPRGGGVVGALPGCKEENGKLVLALTSPPPSATMVAIDTAREAVDADDGGAATTAASTSAASSKFLTLEYLPSVDLSDFQLQQCMELFETNMGLYYKQSSWGLDLTEKADELRHKKARFLLVFADNTAAADDNGEHDGRTADSDGISDLVEGSQKENTNGVERNDDGKKLAAFVHFRFCFDDEDDPEYAVLYTYEIQVNERYQRLGLGRQLASLLEDIARGAELQKCMLTCFKTNRTAMKFYTERLGYEIDESSPSRHGDRTAEYEILSKLLR